MSLGFFIDAFGSVCESIKEWEPTDCVTEKNYENSLLVELQHKFNNKTIISQYGSGKQRVDIVVHDKVPIELKKDLKSNAVLQRTIGQIEQYLKEWECLVLVLCGDVKEDLLRLLKEHVKDKTDIMGDVRVRIIVKK
jgi:hypothetical protein